MVEVLLVMDSTNKPKKSVDEQRIEDQLQAQPFACLIDITKLSGDALANATIIIKENNSTRKLSYGNFVKESAAKAGARTRLRSYTKGDLDIIIPQAPKMLFVKEERMWRIGKTANSEDTLIINSNGAPALSTSWEAREPYLPKGCEKQFIKFLENNSFVRKEPEPDKTKRTFDLHDPEALLAHLRNNKWTEVQKSNWNKPEGKKFQKEDLVAIEIVPQKDHYEIPKLIFSGKPPDIETTQQELVKANIGRIKLTPVIDYKMWAYKKGDAEIAYFGGTTLVVPSRLEDYYKEFMANEIKQEHAAPEM